MAMADNFKAAAPDDGLAPVRWPPVVGGMVIGVAMVLAFFVSGRGIGASGGLTRFAATLQHAIAPQLTEQGAYFARYFAGGAHPLYDYVVFMLIGVLVGSFLGALSGRDLRARILRGPNCSPGRRLLLALSGGLLAGFGARLARGCTSGQALVGGAELSVGAWVFMICIFLGGFAAAWFVRKEWL
jgi:uncharacterized membrane protein YedE/YeeE